MKRRTKQERREAAEEGTAAAGAAAEETGRPLSWNPHRRQGRLRAAWAAGWTLSRAEKMGAEAAKTRPEAA
jgi:IS5 family transposase